MKCGHSNSFGQKFCSSCNAVLPKMTHVPQVAAEPTFVNERYLKIQAASEQALSGELSLEDYAAFLGSVYDALVIKEQEMREIEIPPETFEDFQEELEVGFAGVEMYFEGLRTLQLFVEQQEPSHIEAGLELVREGNELVNQAMRINRENRRKLEEAYLDTSTML
jgi:hypothetical protein